MLGQYRIISEILIFAIGIAIAAFVAITFNDLKDFISETATKDQMLSISNLISGSLIKSISGNTTVRLEIPETISNEVYIISFESASSSQCIIGDCVLRLTTVDTGNTLTHQLFNIGQSHIINGRVYSTAKYIQIISNGNIISVDRE